MSFGIIAAALALTGQAIQTFATVEAGKAAEEAAERRAEEERIAAQAEELKRREELNRVLASNILSQATSGVAAEGTPSSIALDQAKKIGESESIISLSNRLRRQNLLLAGKTQKKASYIQAGASLLKALPSMQTDIETITGSQETTGTS